MQRQEAIKKLAKLLGKSWGYQIDDKALPHDEREIANAELKAASAERNALREACEARAKELLAADMQYQKLLADRQAASRRVSDLQSKTLRHKITVGTRSDLFFHVKAQGDSWEEIFAKLNSK